MFNVVTNRESYQTIIFDTIRIFAGDYRREDFEKDHPYQITVSETSEHIFVTVGSYQKSESILGIDENQKKRLIKKLLFQLIQEHFLPGTQDWGILTGIRPTKIVHRMIDQGLTKTQVAQRMMEDYLITPQKAKLITDMAFLQRPLLLKKEQMYRKIAVYVSIPFCPSICHYCTFGSYHYQKYHKETDGYLQSLHQELREVLSMLKEYQITIDTLYIGGGTPAVLHPDQLESLLAGIAEFCEADSLKEYTFEAGRPDVITEQKLHLLKSFGVNRISINPQIMDDQILSSINRLHTAEETAKIMNMAREFGFDCINMDLIAGLENTQEQFLNSLNQVMNLRPENITLHSLAYKRKSAIRLDPEKLRAKFVRDLFNQTGSMLEERGYHPYYLYKQKLTVSGQENTGFSLPGKESLYNIQMIEERQAVLGFGLGASSKFLNPEDLTLDNVFNSKDLIHYRQTIPEAIDKKKKYLEKLYRGQQNGDQKTERNK